MREKALTYSRALTLMALVILFAAVMPVFSSPDPNLGRTLTGGAYGPCSWFVYLSNGGNGNNIPIANAQVSGLTVNPGDNVVGVAGQDIATFIGSIAVSNTSICFSGQIFSWKSLLVLSNVVGLSLFGQPGATVFKLANNINPNKAMLQINGVSTDITIKGITWDYNRANNSVGTCPNRAWVFELDPGTVRVIIENNVFQNVLCQAIETFTKNMIVSNNFFHDVSMAVFDTGTSTTGFVFSNNIVNNIDATGPNSAVTLEDSALNITISNNVISGLGGRNGISLEPAYNVTISGNTISGFNEGIQVGSPSKYVSIIGNIISGNGFDGIKVILSASCGISIVGNTLLNNGGGLTDQSQIFINGVGNNAVVSGNTLIDTRAGTNRNNFGIYVTSTASLVTVSGNTVDNSEISSIRIEGSASVIVAGNTVNGAKIEATGSSSGVSIYGNMLVSATITVSTDSLSGLQVHNNLGYNPVNGVTNYVSGSNFSPWGSTATLVTTTTYTVQGPDMNIIWSGGTGVTFTVKCGTATVGTGATGNFIVWAGCTINTVFSSAPTVTAIFD